MVWNKTGHPVEPEGRELRQNLPLARNAVRQNAIEGGDTVGGNDQKMIAVDLVDIPHLALAEKFERDVG